MIKLTTKEYKELVEGAVKLKIVSEFLEKQEDNYVNAKELKLILGICTDGDKSEIGKFAFSSHEYGGKMIFCKPPYQPEDRSYESCHRQAEGGDCTSES